MEVSGLEFLTAAVHTGNETTNQGRPRKKPTCVTGEKATILKNMLDGGCGSAQIATTLNTSKRTDQRWVASIEPNIVTSSRKRGPVRRNTMAMRAEVEAIIASDNALTGKRIIERLPEELRCSKSKLSRIIKSMSYTRKRLKPIAAARNSERVISERHVYALRMANALDEELIFIDETGFNLHVCASFGYAPVCATP